MKSYRTHAAVALLVVGLLAGNAKGQLYGSPNAYRGLSTPTYSTGYTAQNYIAPSYTAPSYTAPSYTAPTNAAPTNAAPSYPAPTYRLPSTYSNPTSYNLGQNNGSYSQAPNSARPVPFGFSSLIGPPAAQAAPAPIPQIAPHQNVAPSPSDHSAYGSPVQQYTPMTGQMYSSGAACGAPGMPYASDSVYMGGSLDAFGMGCGRCGQTRRCRCGSNWFGGAYGLFMTRDKENHFAFSFDTANIERQYTINRHTHFDIAGGFGVQFGRYFNCGRNAVQAVYWGVFPDAGHTVTTSGHVAGNLWGIHNWQHLTYNGQTADRWVNGAGGAGASCHALWRDNQFHNVEINLLHFLGCPQTSCSGSRWNVNWLAGVRYFNFKDELMFGSDTNPDGKFTYSDPTEIYYDIMTDNRLVGFQLGADSEFCLTQRLWLDLGVKCGIFGNNVGHSSFIGGSAGDAVINDGPYSGQAFWVQNSVNDVSMLGELDLGLSYYVTCRWKAVAGYRLVGVSGVVLPTNQIYPDLRGLNDVQVIDTNGSLFLHGGYAGLEYNF